MIISRFLVHDMSKATLTKRWNSAEKNCFSENSQRKTEAEENVQVKMSIQHLDMWIRISGGEASLELSTLELLSFKLKLKMLTLAD